MHAAESILLQRKMQPSGLMFKENREDVDAYDCNGDGVPECGQWNYQMGMCHNQAYCGHIYQYPDSTLDMSCRCRRCNDPMFNGTAFADPELQNPNSEFAGRSWGTFKNWADHLDTCARWVMPTSDESLQKLLAWAKNKNYKVRISGAAHSAGGIVTDGQDSSVLVLSLADYKAPDEWEFSWRDMKDGNWRVRVNAGWTQLHLYAKIRPYGLFLPAQTAGYFFQLGGIVANSVHGGAYKEGFVHSYATAMRVMLHNGTIQVLETEEEMRYWRCSFGLLGIILGIEFRLEYRSHLQMYSVAKKLDDWSAESFWKFMKQDAEANVPHDIVPEGGQGSQKSWNGEFFIDFLSGTDTPTAAVYAQKANASVDEGHGGGFPPGAAMEYHKLLSKRVTDDWHGQMSYGEAARRDGAPPIEILGIDVNDMLRALQRLPLAKIMSMSAITNIPRLVKTLSEKVNDGFFLTQSPAALAAAYFVKPEHAFASMDFLRKVQMESIGDKEFVWNLPGEFRFIDVKDSAVLQPVAAGLWFNTQMISFADLAKNDQAWKRDFKRVEDHWVQELGAKPHMGKLWGFETLPNGDVKPFSDAFACTIYSDETKAHFEKYRSQMDPGELFFTGLGKKFLSPCSTSTKAGQQTSPPATSHEPDSLQHSGEPGVTP